MGRIVYELSNQEVCGAQFSVSFLLRGRRIKKVGEIYSNLRPIKYGLISPISGKPGPWPEAADAALRASTGFRKRYNRISDDSARLRASASPRHILPG